LQLRKLILYVVGSLSDEGEEPLTTKTMKVLYLIDVEYYRYFRRTLTSTPWVFYHYGPYSPVIDNQIKQLGFDLAQDEVFTRSGRKAKPLRVQNGSEVDISDDLDFAEKSLVDKTIREWALVDLPTILDHVYFHTEPMEGATRGSELDFTSIPKPERRKEVPIFPKLPADLMAQLRARVADKAAENDRKPQLTPPPRYDKVYWDAISDRDKEEQVKLPEGKLRIEHSTKRSLSKVQE